MLVVERSVTALLSTYLNEDKTQIMDFIVAHGCLQEKEARKFFAQIVDAVGYVSYALFTRNFGLC
jgi:polyhydroxyalkanoate synthesis regulator phasin